MAEYIERKEAEEVMRTIGAPAYAISALHLVNVKKVRPDVHGRWIWGTTLNREWMKCSECLVSQTPTGVFSYCPNCGARMDGE